MRLPFLSLLVILPAFLCLWLVTRLSREESNEKRTRLWVLLILGVACVLLAIVSIGAQGFVDGDIPIAVSFVLPAVVGVLALILIEWRKVLAVWKKEKVLISGLLGLLLALLLSSLRYGGMRSLFVFVPALLVALIWTLGGVVGLKGLEIAGVLVGAFLLLDAGGILAHPIIIVSPELRSAYSLVLILAKILALVITARLIYQWGRVDQARSGRDLVIWFGVISFLLFSMGAVEFRYAVLVKATGRAAEDHAPYIGVMMGIMTGLVLAGVSTGKGRRIGFLYMFLVPLLLIASFAAGFLLDPHGITSERADRIHEAIARYQLENGVYPASIHELTPRYTPFILGPLNGRGQVWCYQGGGDYFRLGYVFYERYHRETFPTPFYEVRIFARDGQPPVGEWMCDQEMQKHTRTLGL